LTITFWNEIILDEIIENHIRKSRELKVNIPRRVGASLAHGPPSLSLDGILFL
jgi:hypothetical protein